MRSRSSASVSNKNVYGFISNLIAFQSEDNIFNDENFYLIID